MTPPWLCSMGVQVVELEQWLMEGAYNKVLDARSRAASGGQPQPHSLRWAASAAQPQVGSLRCAASGAQPQVGSLRCAASGAQPQVRSLRWAASGAQPQVGSLRCAASGGQPQVCSLMWAALLSMGGSAGVREPACGCGCCVQAPTPPTWSL